MHTYFRMIPQADQSLFGGNPAAAPASALAGSLRCILNTGTVAVVVAGLDLGHSVVKDAYMTSETNSAAKSRQESVVVASFDSYRHAEHMLASLGRGFRKKARKGGTTAVVVRGNPDGSLKVTESRVLSASDLASTLIRVSLAVTIGFMGLFSTLKGAKSEAHAAVIVPGWPGT